MPRSLRLALCLILVLGATGCGSRGHSDGVLNHSDVINAFSAAGIQLRHMGKTAGVDDYVNAGFVEVRSPRGPWLEVEIFPTLRLARLVRNIGGNIAGADGRLVRPLAVIRNVVITRFETATKRERAKALRAVRLLRQRG